MLIIKRRRYRAVYISIPPQLPRLFLTNLPLIIFLYNAFPHGLYVKTNITREVTRISTNTIVDGNILAIRGDGWRISYPTSSSYASRPLCGVW